MALIYSLAIECGPDDAAARACAAHFAEWTGAPGQPAPPDLHVGESGDEQVPPNLWVVVTPVDEGRVGVTDASVAASMTAAGHRLLERLRTAPPFRFAVIGVEPVRAYDYGDLDAELAQQDGFARRAHGLVVDRAIYERMGRPAALKPFGQERYWIPYRGERWPSGA